LSVITRCTQDDITAAAVLDLDDRGVVAAITNRREAAPDGQAVPAPDPALPSRGGLCLRLLGQPSTGAAYRPVALAPAAR
jgi:hypothetical protein